MGSGDLHPEVVQGHEEPGDDPADAAKVEAEPPSDPVGSPGAGALILGPDEIQQFAGALATQLFQRWEVALHQQFQEELALRLKAELEHREREARDLREELDDRRVMWEGVWTKRHPRGMTNDYSTWEVRQKLNRQTSELAEAQRQMRELRERLRELGHEPAETTVTVEAESEPPPDLGPVMDGPRPPGDGWVGGHATGGY